MRAFYEDNHEEYFQTTVAVEPSSFLSPLTAQLAPGATILDVGCGSGRDLRWLAARGYQPTGFELSPGLAGKAREYSQCPVIEGDFTVFDFSTLQYNAVLLTGALVHIPRSDFSSTLINISSALRTHGLLYLSMKEGDGISQSPDGRVFTLWQPESLEQTLQANGFDILSSSRSRSLVTAGDVFLGYLLRKRG